MKSPEAVRRIVDGLAAQYPDARCSLDHMKDYELLFAVRLSAQCTDARVNLVTPALFARYPTLEDFAAADFDELSEIIRSCGFFRAKARDIIAAAGMLLTEYDGKVPDTMEDLLRLPGVGRKTANLILGDIYDKPAVVTDTHCIRIAGRLGLTDGTKEPEKAERQLWAVLPPEEANLFCHRIVHFGRDICTARKPDCARCPIAVDCDYFHTAEANAHAAV